VEGTSKLNKKKKEVEPSHDFSFLHNTEKVHKGLNEAEQQELKKKKPKYLISVILCHDSKECTKIGPKRHRKAGNTEG